MKKEIEKRTKKNDYTINFFVENDKFVIYFSKSPMCIMVWIGDSVERVSVRGKISAEVLSFLFLRLVDNKKMIEDDTDVLIKNIIERIIEEVIKELTVI